MKQVIVIRKDLKMRRGKECAQASHGSMLWLANRLNKKQDFSLEELHWLNGKMTKICCQVNSEEELINYYNKAVEKGLLAYIVTDSGATEFHGVETKTVLCIGPNDSEKIDEVTKELRLY